MAFKSIMGCGPCPVSAACIVGTEISDVTIARCTECKRYIIKWWAAEPDIGQRKIKTAVMDTLPTSEHCKYFQNPDSILVGWAFCEDCHKAMKERFG
jgi:hypothetical protein